MRNVKCLLSETMIEEFKDETMKLFAKGQLLAQDSVPLCPPWLRIFV